MKSRPEIGKKLRRRYSHSRSPAELSSEEERSWEMVDREEATAPRRPAPAAAASTGRPALRRRNRSAVREEAVVTPARVRSRSLQPANRSSAEFCDQLSKRLSGEFGGDSMQNIQVKRRDSFLDISIPIDDSRSDASLDSLMFFSQTITDTANSFQQAHNQTEKLPTSEKLKQTNSDKNISNPIAEIQSKPAEFPCDTVGANPSAKWEELLEDSPAPRGQAGAGDPVARPDTAPRGQTGAGDPIARLDTITSQSELEPSDNEMDDILRFVPVNQPLHKLKEGPGSAGSQGSPFSPVLPPSPAADTRPGSASSEISFRTPFGRTCNTSSAKDIFKQIAQTKQEVEYERAVSRQRSLSRSRYREESQSPERYGRARLRGRESTRGPPGNRTQSAAPGPAEQRSSSATRPASAAGFTTPLSRTPSYRLLGGKLVDSVISRGWRDDGVTPEQPAGSAGITR